MKLPRTTNQALGVLGIKPQRMTPELEATALAEWKAKTVEARRSGNDALAAVLSAAKQLIKGRGKSRICPKCKGPKNPEGEHCIMCARMLRYHARSLASAVALILAAIACCAAESVTLSWTPPVDDCGFTGTNMPSGQCVVNYRVYWGHSSGYYLNSFDCGHVTNTVWYQISPGLTYYAVVTALNEEGGESDPSNEIHFTVPGGVSPPTNVFRGRLVFRQLKPKLVRFR